jgi:hypothetical protein
MHLFGSKSSPAVHDQARPIGQGFRNQTRYQHLYIATARMSENFGHDLDANKVKISSAIKYLPMHFVTTTPPNHPIPSLSIPTLPMHPKCLFLS